MLILLLSSRVRFHYGHPDVFDRLFHVTRGGVSKASKVINLSEDIFAGMRRRHLTENIKYHISFSLCILVFPLTSSV